MALKLLASSNWYLPLRLGHEAGAVTVLERHATGAAAEQGGPVGGAHAIVEVAEVDLELAWADFGGDHRDIDALILGGLRHVVQHIAEARQPFDMQVGLVIGVIAQRVAGELRQAVVEFFVEQVELQLKRPRPVER